MELLKNMKIRKNPNRSLLKAAQKFQPFDYGYLLSIEKVALKRMADYFDKADLAVSDKRSAKEIRLALKLLDIVLDEDSAYNPGKVVIEGHTLKHVEGDNMNVYVNTRNWNRFFSHDCDWSKPILQDDLRNQKAWYLYNKLKYYYQRGWWN